MKEKINPNVVRANVWRWRQDHGKTKTVAKVQHAKPVAPEPANYYVSTADLAKIHRQASQFGQGIPL